MCAERNGGQRRRPVDSGMPTPFTGRTAFAGAEPTNVDSIEKRRVSDEEDFCAIIVQHVRAQCSFDEYTNHESVTAFFSIAESFCCRALAAILASVKAARFSWALAGSTSSLLP